MTLITHPKFSHYTIRSSHELEKLSVAPESSNLECRILLLQKWSVWSETLLAFPFKKGKINSEIYFAQLHSARMFI